MQMIILDIKAMIPEGHFLRQIKDCVNFDFIYEKAALNNSNVGRKSICPVILMKMLLAGYLYGIKSERRLEEEISLNLAYRWFCEIDLMDRVPDYSIFSQNRRRRSQDNQILGELFYSIVLQCIEEGLVSGEAVADGSFLSANVSLISSAESIEIIQQSTIHYLDALEAEIFAMPGYQTPVPVEVQKRTLKSRTDPDCGYINQSLSKQSDCSHASFFHRLL